MNKLLFLSTCLLFIVLCSCNSKNNENAVDNNIPIIINQDNIQKVEMIYPIEYYKEKIINNYANYHNGTIDDLNFNLLKISSIVEIDNIIPNLLTFFVKWSDIRGYTYMFYTFDESQNIINRHFCNFKRLPNSHRQKLMEKLTGAIIENELISIGDFNNDGINEILSYAWHQNIGDVFTVYGYNIFTNEIEAFCLVPVFINYDDPFSSAEYIENGFKILEIISEEKNALDLAWNNYIWDNNVMKYIKK